MSPLTSSHRVVAYLPCRAGSERVPRKNTRAFGGRQDGLVGIKLEQLLAVPAIDEVVLDTNDPAVLGLGHAANHDRLRVNERPDELGRSETSTDELIAYALSVVDADVLLWTHVTSPFLEASHYASILTSYDDALRRGFDSLMTVTPIRTFLWTKDGPMNYAPDERRWPRTQDIEPVYEVNSGAFVVPMTIARHRQDRIGERPELFEMSGLPTFDIDWPEDFDMADEIWRQRHGSA